MRYSTLRIIHELFSDKIAMMSREVRENEKRKKEIDEKIAEINSEIRNLKGHVPKNIQNSYDKAEEERENQIERIAELTSKLEKMRYAFSDFTSTDWH